MHSSQGSCLLATGEQMSSRGAALLPLHHLKLQQQSAAQTPALVFWGGGGGLKPDHDSHRTQIKGEAKASRDRVSFDGSEETPPTALLLSFRCSSH